MTVLGLVLLVVPGLIAAAGRYVAEPAAVADDDLPATASLSASWSLTAGHRWGALALATAFLMVALATALATGTLAEVAGGWGGIGPIVGALGGILSALALALQSIAAAVTYRALHAEKAGPDAPALAARVRVAPVAPPGRSQATCPCSARAAAGVDDHPLPTDASAAAPAPLYTSPWGSGFAPRAGAEAATSTRPAGGPT